MSASDEAQPKPAPDSAPEAPPPSGMSGLIGPESPAPESLPDPNSTTTTSPQTPASSLPQKAVSAAAEPSPASVPLIPEAPPPADLPKSSEVPEPSRREQVPRSVCRSRRQKRRDHRFRNLKYLRRQFLCRSLHQPRRLQKQYRTHRRLELLPTRLTSISATAGSASRHRVQRPGRAASPRVQSIFRSANPKMISIDASYTLPAAQRARLLHGMKASTNIGCGIDTFRPKLSPVGRTGQSS